ncbi:MAG: SBBP repeat-containing protein [Thermodesulfobacteriota bacterium]
MARHVIAHEVIESVAVKTPALAMALTVTIALSICILSLRLPSAELLRSPSCHFERGEKPYVIMPRISQSLRSFEMTPLHQQVGPGTEYRNPIAWSSASQAEVLSQAKTGSLHEARLGSTFSLFVANGLLQFTSAGHVLGFREKEVFIAAGDHALKVEFLGARAAIPHAQERPEGIASVLRGGRPLGRVTYSDVWDGVSVVYESSPGAVVKSTYYIAPRTDHAGHTGSRVDQIHLRYNVPVRLDDKGNLVIPFETGDLTESPPVAWQEIEGRRIPVAVVYCLFGEKEVGFTLGAYDPSHPLVIDPKLVWNTFMGSTGSDSGGSIALDKSGNIYVAGISNATWGAPVNGYAGGLDAFAAKLNSSGVRLWHTFAGSASNDYAYGIAVDNSGNVHLTGTSEATWGAPVDAHAGGEDVFAVKLNSSGARLWNTFMGSGVNDGNGGVAVDNSGNVYVSGRSLATWGAPVNGFAGGTDTFAVKLDSNGARVWTTFMGSGSGDWDEGIAVDDTGNVYVAGYANATWGAPVNGHAGGSHDGFVAKLDNNGARLWHTFMGSGGTDYCLGIAVDAGGNVYVAGESNATWGTPVNGFTSGTEAFAAKLDSNGVRLWHTFMGSTGTDNALGIAVDKGGSLFVGGNSSATWGTPVKDHAGGTNDAFAVRLNGDGTRRWNTFMGSSGADSDSGIAVDDCGFLYVIGSSDTAWGTPVSGHAGGNDAFVAKHTTADIKAKQFYFSPVHNLKE